MAAHIDDHLKLYLAKSQKYCAYQERCQQEVMEKLLQLGATTNEANEVIAHLITENFINEQRFAIQFAGGKFRIKHWGKNKITLALKLRNISAYCIHHALKEIPMHEYKSTMLKLIHKEAQKIKDTNPLVKNNKISKALISKGYEPDMVWNALLER